MTFRDRAFTAIAFVILFSSVQADAQVAIGMKLQHTQLMKYEPVVVFVTIANRSGAPLIINGDQPDNLRLSFDIKDRRGNWVPRLEGAPSFEETRIDPNGSRRIMVQVSRHYVFNRWGGYHVNAVVTTGEFRYKSHTKHLEIVRGLPMTETIGHIPSKPTLRRRYQLRYVTREGGETLFLQVSDLPDERLIGTYTLGRLLRVQQPEIGFDKRGHLRVRHQSAPNQITFTTFEVEADQLYLLDQANERLRRGLAGGTLNADEL